MSAKVIQEPLYFTQRRNKEIFRFVCPHCGAVVEYTPTKDCYDIDSPSKNPVKIKDLSFAEVVYCPTKDCIGEYDGVVVRYDIWPYEDWVVYDDIVGDDPQPNRYDQEVDMRTKHIIDKYYE